MSHSFKEVISKPSINLRLFFPLPTFSEADHQLMYFFLAKIRSNFRQIGIHNYIGTMKQMLVERMGNHAHQKINSYHENGRWTKINSFKLHDNLTDVMHFQSSSFCFFLFVRSIYKADSKSLENIENNNVSTSTTTSTTSTSTDSDQLCDRIKSEPVTHKRTQSVSPSELQSK